MDKAQALHTFWSSFGLLAFDENSVYDENMNLPDNYLTYEVKTAALGTTLSLSASLWYRSTSWADISKKADQIADYIGQRRILVIDEGYIVIRRGSIFAQRMGVDQDVSIRRIILTINVEFLTTT